MGWLSWGNHTREFYYYNPIKAVAIQNDYPEGQYSKYLILSVALDSKSIHPFFIYTIYDKSSRHAID